MPHPRLADTPLFPLLVVLQILPQAWPGFPWRKPAGDRRPVAAEDGNRTRMERLIRAIDETRANGAK